ncbi:hemerythrin domain-containing protein [Actinocrispum wychmicini]|uniref:Hemerythrin HHE cation binding domain-containing protein n=1 Tax=Actinocrispum wychmicini TaxID=1213861 RepID=A0A4R2J878_9PSEU|nr:hemerythrin domain-containing protein [Actinocrispum wychmicini]TCO52836.1 hemerythrin HHE cation binding domain-containing protein [Actinocrispum wychmicini]
MNTNEQGLSTKNGVEGLPEHIRAFALMHVAMRRDSARLVAAAPKVTGSTAPAVGAWFRQLFDIIDWHHRTEDDVLFPDIRRRVPSFAAKEQALAHDHTALDQAMAAVAATLAPGGDLAKLPVAAEKFRTILLEHLDLEETVVFPVFVNDLSVRTYLEVERRVVGTAPMSLRTILYPWMFDGIDRRTAARVAQATIPLPVRLIGDTVLKMRYQRAIATVVSLAS